MTGLQTQRRFEPNQIQWNKKIKAIKRENERMEEGERKRLKNEMSLCVSLKSVETKKGAIMGIKVCKRVARAEGGRDQLIMFEGGIGRAINKLIKMESEGNKMGLTKDDLERSLWLPHSSCRKGSSHK